MIDINESVDNTRAIMGDLLAAGAWSYRMPHGRYISWHLGNVALKVLRSGTLPLSKVGDITLYVEALVQSAPVMLTCYVHRECSSMTDSGQNKLSRKVSRTNGAASKLQSLPSTNESFMENVARSLM